MASQEGISQDQTVNPGIDVHLQTQSMFETLARIEECSTLYNLIERADLAYSLRRSGLRTLFAPSNDALTDVTPEDLDAFLEHHTANGAMETVDLRRVKTLKTLDGQTSEVKMSDNTVRIGPATIVRADVPCTNGVIQVVDSVL